MKEVHWMEFVSIIYYINWAVSVNEKVSKSILYCANIVPCINCLLGSYVVPCINCLLGSVTFVGYLHVPIIDDTVNSLVLQALINFYAFWQNKHNTQRTIIHNYTLVWHLKCYSYCNSGRPEPIVLVNLLIILFFRSQCCYPLFLSIFSLFQQISDNSTKKCRSVILQMLLYYSLEVWRLVVLESTHSNFMLRCSWRWLY